MRKIFALFILCTLCLCPILANADSCNTHNGDQSGCLALGGCKWQQDDVDEPGYCNVCDSGTAHAPCTGTNCSEFCLSCSDEWQYDENKVFNPSDPNATATGQSTCPWKCEAGYFRNNAGTHCLKCPGNGATYYNYAAYPDHSSTSDFTDMHGVQAQNINECFLDSTDGAINPCGTGKYLIKTTASATDTQPVYFCGICGDNGTLVSNNYGLQDFQINTCPDCNTSAFVNTYYGQRGTNPRVQCDCPDNSILTNGVCTCNAPLHIVQVPDTNQSHCALCPEYASPSPTDNRQCKCNIGFYGDGNVSCTRCPNGATTEATGSTQLSDCKIKSNAKFCIDTSTSRTLDLTNGRHCFYLHSTPNQHNGYTAADIH